MSRLTHSVQVNTITNGVYVIATGDGDLRHYMVKTRVKTGKAQDLLGLEEPKYITYMEFDDFEYKHDSLSAVELNNMKMMIIEYFIDNFHIFPYFRSSAKERDTIYKVLYPVKGKKFSLKPVYKLVS